MDCARARYGVSTPVKSSERWGSNVLGHSKDHLVRVRPLSCSRLLKSVLIFRVVFARNSSPLSPVTPAPPSHSCSMWNQLWTNTHLPGSVVSLCQLTPPERIQTLGAWLSRCSDLAKRLSFIPAPSIELISSWLHQRSVSVLSILGSRKLKPCWNVWENAVNTILHWSTTNYCYRRHLLYICMGVSKWMTVFSFWGELLLVCKQLISFQT